MTKSKEIVAMVNTVYSSKQLLILGSCLKNKSDFFTEPFLSSYINVYESIDNTFDTPKLYNVTDIKCKLVTLEYRQQYVFFPLLHTYTK